MLFKDGLRACNYIVYQSKSGLSVLRITNKYRHSLHPKSPTYTMKYVLVLLWETIDI